MMKAVFIIVNSQEFVCDKKYIMEISPVVREYFENNSKEENFICNIDSFQGNESIFKDFLKGEVIKVTYDKIPFITSLSNVFGLNCFDDQLKNLKNSYQKVIKNTDTHFSLFEKHSNLVLNENYESISNELTTDNYQFFARSFLSLFLINPKKMSEYKTFLKELEQTKNIPIYQEFEKLTKMKHFFIRFKAYFLSIFKSPLFLKNFEDEIEFNLNEDEHHEQYNESKELFNNYINQLYSILEKDDVDSLQLFVSSPEFDINSRIFDVSIIEYSAFLSSIKCFKFLISNHAQIDLRTVKFAIAGGNTEIVHLCEQHGCSFESTLEISVLYHQQNMFDWLLETKKQKINEDVVKSCFFTSNFEILNQILADQNIALNDLLIYSAEFSQLSFFQCILKLPGIDVDHKNMKGVTSLHFGCLNDDFQLVQFILNCPIARSVDVNSKILHEDISPLHIACSNDCIEIVKLLLSNPKIDVNSQTFYTNRMTSLHFACKYGNFEIVNLLLNNKLVNINAMTYDHATPFYYACKNGFVDIVKLLIENNAETDTVNLKNSTTPILIAAVHNHFDIVQLIVSTENVNNETNLGETLLLLSSKSGNVEVTKKLISEYNADILHKNKKGLNALHYACKGKDCKEMVDFLISKKCDFKDETKNNKVPLHYACKHGNYEQVGCLLNYCPELLKKKDGKI